MLETLAFEVATFRHLPDDAVVHRPVSWLLAEYERVAEARWRATTEQVVAVQLGVSRALAAALGGKGLKELPTYEELLEEQGRPEEQLPAWQRRFEQVNVGSKE